MANKLLLTFALSLMLVACGPSEEQIRNTSLVTCNVMGESRNMDAAFRIKEINAAREKLGAGPYLGSDQGIKEAFEYDLCAELVSGDPEYARKLARRKAFIEENARERLKAEQRALQKKTADERKASEERKASFTASPLKIVRATLLAGESIQVELDCRDVKSPLVGSLRLVLKDSAGALFLDGTICPAPKPLVLTNASASTKKYLRGRHALDAINYAYIMVDGDASKSGADFRLDLGIVGR